MADYVEVTVLNSDYTHIRLKETKIEYAKLQIVPILVLRDLAVDLY
jgi:hypothetical protein